jgi:hypothetical protein
LIDLPFAKPCASAAAPLLQTPDSVKLVAIEAFDWASMNIMATAKSRDLRMPHNRSLHQ